MRQVIGGHVLDISQDYNCRPWFRGDQQSSRCPLLASIVANRPFLATTVIASYCVTVAW